jgi:apolipoprotein N-acyltransferase
LIERALAALKGRCAYLAAAGLGALQSLAFAPRALAPLGILCLTALWWLTRSARPGRAARLGFAFGFGLFFAGTYWVYISIHLVGGAPAALALLLMLGLVAIMAGYLALLGALTARFKARSALAQALLVLPSSWVLIEWLRGWVLSGFPWLALGYSQIDTPLAGYAPIAGVYALSLVAAVTAGSLLVLVTESGRTRLIALALALALWLTGPLLGRLRFTAPSAAPLAVAVIQGAIPQDLKWQEDNRLHTLSVYRTLTEQAWGSRLIVWPEAALPALYHELRPYLSQLEAEAVQHDADLMLGLLRYDFSTDRFYNALLALPSGDWYYKRHLVPFGEYFPVPGFIRAWMRLKNLAYVDMSPGDAQQAPLSAAGQSFAATICYEDAYGGAQLATLDRATLLVNVSNDAWFGGSSAPHQHLQITRMRALEAGRYMVRATNNGISALIDARGRVYARSPQFVPDVLRGEVVPYAGLTPYARAGNAPVVLICMVALLIGLAVRGRARGTEAPDAGRNDASQSTRTQMPR